jgi:hypothetical protein
MVLSPVSWVFGWVSSDWVVIFGVVTGDHPASSLDFPLVSVAVDKPLLFFFFFFFFNFLHNFSNV